MHLLLVLALASEGQPSVRKTTYTLTGLHGCPAICPGVSSRVPLTTCTLSCTCLQGLYAFFVEQCRQNLHMVSEPPMSLLAGHNLNSWPVVDNSVCLTECIELSAAHKQQQQQQQQQVSCMSPVSSRLCTPTHPPIPQVIAMSPVGNAFRERLRKFPSLVNCCTIDWWV
jgi:hypothetical protein